MNMHIHKLTRFSAAVAVAVPTALGSAAAQEASSAQRAYDDMKATLGQVPAMLEVFPETGIAGAWTEMKTFQLNPNTELSNRVKELVGLAVAAQIPCDYCVYFHTQAAKANGASEAEVREAVAMAAMTRHWSTVLNGMEVDLETFKQETDEMLQFAGEKAAQAAAESDQ